MKKQEHTIPPHVRVLELPNCKMASSGYAREVEPFVSGGTLARFQDWWVEADKARVDRWFARDFLMYERSEEAMVWLYALADDAPLESCPFAVTDFSGGLYAASVATGDTQAEGERVLAGVRAWVRENPVFELDERPGHYDLRHVITPKRVEKAIGQVQLEIYVPIRVKQPPSRPGTGNASPQPPSV